MKKIKILGILTHYKIKKNRKTGKEVIYTGGVDLYRVVQPLLSLPKDLFEVDLVHDVLDKYKTVDELTQHYDIMYSSYLEDIPLYVQLKMAANRNGCVWAMDLDDNLWDVSKTHPHYKKDYAPGTPSFEDKIAILKDTDHLTTTNNFLKYEMARQLAKRNSQIKIMPNCIDLKLFDYKKIKTKPHKGIQIGYMGGASHFDDINKPEFTKAIKIIMDKYEDVSLKTTFYMPQLKALFGYKYKYTLGRFNVYRYAKEVWTEMSGESDIWVAPLSQTRYSRAKSYVKFLEYSATKLPSVMEKIDPYNEILSGKEDVGLQATTTDEWVDKLSYLIENPDKRREMGEKAYKYVKDNFTTQSVVKLYTDYFLHLTE